MASTVGLGSAFRVELPLAIVNAAAPPFLSAPVRVLIASPSATPSHPLSPTLAPTLLAMLGEVGAQGVLAAGLDHARERIAAEPFAAVLVDRTLGGDEVADLLGAARGRGIRGIVLLAPAERHELDRLKAAGASGYLIKPIRMASLIEQLEGRRWRSCEPDGQLAPAAPLGGRSVLLADDNDINALVARTMHGRLGAEVVLARDGSEAVEAFRRRRFDAVLLDMQMPGLDGPAAARLIRAAEKGERAPADADLCADGEWPRRGPRPLPRGGDGRLSGQADPSRWPPRSLRTGARKCRLRLSHFGWMLVIEAKSLRQSQFRRLRGTSMTTTMATSMPKALLGLMASRIGFRVSTVRSWQASAAAGMPSTLARIGPLEVRLAQSARDIRQAQRLRFKVFYGEMAATPDASALLFRRDRDVYDRACEHLIVLDHGAGPTGAAPRVVGTYRLLRQAVAERHAGFYSAREFDIGPLLEAHSGKRSLELGRACVLAPYRTKRTVELLWQGIWAYAQRHQIDVMIGCACLEGTDIGRHTLPLAFLHHHARASQEWQASARPSLYVGMDRMERDEVDARKRCRPCRPCSRAICGSVRCSATAP